MHVYTTPLFVDRQGRRQIIMDLSSTTVYEEVEDYYHKAASQRGVSGWMSDGVWRRWGTPKLTLKLTLKLTRKRRDLDDGLAMDKYSQMNQSTLILIPREGRA